MKTKVCFKCEVEQPIVNFYKHPKMADGHLGKCKSCTRYDVRKNYAEKIDQYREYDKRRYRENPAKRTPRQRTGEKRRADIAFHNALNRGKIARRPCEVCGAEKVEGHHADYSKPLDVMWLCRKHHRVLHRMNTEVPLNV